VDGVAVLPRSDSKRGSPIKYSESPGWDTLSGEVWTNNLCWFSRLILATERVEIKDQQLTEMDPIFKAINIAVRVPLEM
jgi:hypothetical protein